MQVESNATHLVGYFEAAQMLGVVVEGELAERLGFPAGGLQGLFDSMAMLAGPTDAERWI